MYIIVHTVQLVTQTHRFILHSNHPGKQRVLCTQIFTHVTNWWIQNQWINTPQ